MKCVKSACNRYKYRSVCSNAICFVDESVCHSYNVQTSLFVEKLFLCAIMAVTAF